MALKIPVPVERELHSIEVETPDLDSTPPVTFPSAYWNNRNQKPDLSIHQGSINFYYYIMQDLLHRQKWNDNAMAGYLIRYIQTYPDQFETSSPTEWSSNCIVLAKAGEVVNPLNLLHIEGDGKFIMDPEANVYYMKQMRLYHFVSLIMAFRKFITSWNNQTHGTEFWRNMDNELKNSEFPVNGTVSSKFTYCYSLNIASPKYLKVLCAIDMFYFKFPDHPAAVLRLGTKSLRYIECEMFSSITDVKKKLCMTLYQLELFVFSDEIRKELRNFTKKGKIDNDIDHYSYFPYCKGLGIIKRSPYSILQNPNLYLWLRTIMCMLGVAESYNDRMPDFCVEVVPTIHAAAALASIAGELGITLQEAVQEGCFPDRPYKLETLRQQAAELFNSLTRHSGLSPHQKVFAKVKAKGMRNCPPNSIGLYLHNHFSGLACPKLHCLSPT